MGEPAVTWTVADEIRKARKQAHLKQDDIAVALGCSRQTVSAWENGHSEPSISEFRAIAKATGADWLLGQNWKKMTRHLALVPPILGQLELDLHEKTLNPDN